MKKFYRVWIDKIKTIFYYDYGCYSILYVDTDCMLNDNITSIYNMFNDFYNSHPEEFLKAFTKHTGYDHSYHVQPNGEHHVVVFHPTQIKSIHSKFEKRNADLLEDKISNCTECGSPYSLIEKRMFGSATCKQGHTYKPIITYGEF